MCTFRCRLPGPYDKMSFPLPDTLRWLLLIMRKYLVWPLAILFLHILLSFSRMSIRSLSPWGYPAYYLVTSSLSCILSAPAILLLPDPLILSHGLYGYRCHLSQRILCHMVLASFVLSLYHLAFVTCLYLVTNVTILYLVTNVTKLILSVTWHSWSCH